MRRIPFALIPESGIRVLVLFVLACGPARNAFGWPTQSEAEVLFERAITASECARGLYVELLEKAAEKGSWEAARNLAAYFNADRRKDLEWSRRAQSLLRAHAEAGDLSAMLELARLGDPLTPRPRKPSVESLDKVASLALKRAERGDAGAAVVLVKLHAIEDWPKHSQEEILRWTQRAAKASSPKVLADLGRVTWSSQDERVAEIGLRALERAAEGGSAKALEELTLLIHPGNVEKLMPLVRKFAEAGEPRAQYILGSNLSEGGWLDPSPREARRWLELAAKAGIPEAQVELGEHLEDGTFGSPDVSKAQDWFVVASGQGYCGGFSALGHSTLREAASIADPARRELKYAASRAALVASSKSFMPKGSDLEALGFLFSTGLGGRTDRSSGCRYYGEAVRRNSKTAQVEWAKCLISGDGGTWDAPEGLRVLRDVAASDGPGAQPAYAAMTLGELYERGNGGLAQDYVKAREWYESAGGLGYWPAFERLGEIYEQGSLAPRDNARAYVYYSVAAALGAGGRAEERRDALVETLPRQRLEAAQRQASQILDRIQGEPQEGTPPRSRAEPESPTAKTGSGFAVKDEIIVTNAHVVNGCSLITVQGRRALVIARDIEHDLALLKGGAKFPSVATLRRGGPIQSGESVVVVGFPLAGVVSSEMNVATGNISATTGLKDDRRYLQITAPIQPGNSGGPLLDSSGHVIGVVSATLSTVKFANATGTIPQNLNFAISLETLRTFLRAQHVNAAEGESQSSLAPQEIASAARGYTVPVVCQ